MHLTLGGCKPDASRIHPAICELHAHGCSYMHQALQHVRLRCLGSGTRHARQSSPWQAQQQLAPASGLRLGFASVALLTQLLGLPARAVIIVYGAQCRACRVRVRVRVKACSLAGGDSRFFDGCLRLQT